MAVFVAGCSRSLKATLMVNAVWNWQKAKGGDGRWQSIGGSLTDPSAEGSEAHQDGACHNKAQQAIQRLWVDLQTWQDEGPRHWRHLRNKAGLSWIHLLHSWACQENAQKQHARLQVPGRLIRWGDRHSYDRARDSVRQVYYCRQHHDAPCVCGASGEGRCSPYFVCNCLCHGKCWCNLETKASCYWDGRG